MIVTEEWCLLLSKDVLSFAIVNNRMKGDYCQNGLVPMAIVSFVLYFLNILGTM